MSGDQKIKELVVKYQDLTKKLPFYKQKIAAVKQECNTVTTCFHSEQFRV